MAKILALDFPITAQVELKTPPTPRRGRSP